MKKQFLFLAFGALVLASCGGNSGQGQTQTQTDSIANAVMAAKNDSASNALAKEKAELNAREHHDEKKREEANATTTQDATPTPPPAAAPVKTAQDNKFDSRQPGNQSNKVQLTPDQQKAQDDKFNSRK